MRDKIEKIFNEEVRPILSSHGGEIELVEVTSEGIVRVKLNGGCACCPGAQMTLTTVVEDAIKSRIPEVKKVELG